MEPSNGLFFRWRFDSLNYKQKEDLLFSALKQLYSRPGYLDILLGVEFWIDHLDKSCWTVSAERRADGLELNLTV